MKMKSEEIWNRMTNNNKEVQNPSFSFMEKLSKYYQHFACKLCHPDTTNFIKSDANNNYHIQWKLSNFNKAAKILSEMRKFLQDHDYHFKILTSLSKIWDGHEIKNFMREIETREYSNTLENCQDISFLNDFTNYKCAEAKIVDKGQLRIDNEYLVTFIKLYKILNTY